MTKYGKSDTGFVALVAQFESFAQSNIVDQIFSSGGAAAAVSWVEKHLVGPQIITVVKDQLRKHRAAIVPAIPQTPANPATPKA